jgi:hypothetical protein
MIRANFNVPMLLLTLMMAAPVHAASPKVAVFDLELIDTSAEGDAGGAPAGEHDRLMRAGQQLRRELAESGKFEVLDIAPVSAAAQGSNLQACGGCDVQLALKLGADLAMTGVVQKVSALILNIGIYVRDTHSGRLIASMTVDLRGNTDESWSRALSYLLRNRLLAPNYGAPQPQ